MKRLLSISILILLTSWSCSTSNSYKTEINYVQYFKSMIQTIDRNYIFLANGTEWKTDRFVIAVNLTDIFLVMTNYGFNYAFINGTKYNISPINDGIEHLQYHRGYLHRLSKLNTESNEIKLLDGSIWKVIEKGDVNIGNWSSDSEMIVDESDNIIINPRRIEAVRVDRIMSENLTKSPI